MLRPFAFWMMTALLLGTTAMPLTAQPEAATATAAAREKVIIDTDIGDDIDDAFAIGLALRSPELDILGITTAWGQTDLRARIVERMLRDNGRSDIPVAVGVQTAAPIGNQSRWIGRSDPGATAGMPAVDFIIQQLRRYPHLITLVCIGPETNMGAVIDKAPDAFRLARRVVMMGGSIRYSYADIGFTPPTGPVPEYNLYRDVAAAQKVFSAGVPIIMLGLDVTNELKLGETKRHLLFTAGTKLTEDLGSLYLLWGQETPTLFDVMAMATAIGSDFCDFEPLHVTVESNGLTRVTPGPPNVLAGFNAHHDRFWGFVLPRLLKQPATVHGTS
jgi:purine nucleosidase